MMDALTRRARMRGFDVLWLPGMDHASIAVHDPRRAPPRRDRGQGPLRLHPRGVRRQGLGVEGALRRSDPRPDAPPRRRRRLDARAVHHGRRASPAPSRRSSRRLYDDDLIYRAERIINWCPRDLTALSDAEVDHTDEPGELVSIRYGDGDASIVVATTRAETMLGDTAVAVHPDDERYRHLIGTEVALPLTNRRIPIIADEHVDPSFGTGAVKVTPAHDPNDFEIGRRHDLPMPTIMDERGGDHRARPVRRASTGSRRASRSSPRCARTAASSPRSVRTCTRSGTARAATPSIEPRLSLQWWVRVETLAKAAGDAVRDGRMKYRAGVDWRRATSSGSTTCATGASAGSCGGATASRSGTHPTATTSASARTRRRRPAGRRTRTCSTPGSRRALWPFSTLGWPERHRGPARATTRPRCWSPATTSCSSGSCG